jgi:hypothetical protein
VLRRGSRVIRLSYRVRTGGNVISLPRTVGGRALPPGRWSVRVTAPAGTGAARSASLLIRRR